MLGLENFYLWLYIDRYEFLALFANFWWLNADCMSYMYNRSERVESVQDIKFCIVDPKLFAGNYVSIQYLLFVK